MALQPDLLFCSVLPSSAIVTFVMQMQPVSFGRVDTKSPISMAQLLVTVQPCLPCCFCAIAVELYQALFRLSQRPFTFVLRAWRGQPCMFPRMLECWKSGHGILAGCLHASPGLQVHTHASTPLRLVKAMHAFSIETKFGLMGHRDDKHGSVVLLNCLQVTILRTLLSLSRGPLPSVYFSFLWDLSLTGSQELHSAIDPSYCRLLNNWLL